MRRLSALATALLVASVAVLVGSHAVSAKGGKVVAQASGSGHVTFNGQFRSFSFTARQYADGTDAGQAQFRNRGQVDTPMHVDVTCLSVVGNEAHMSGVLKNVAKDVPPFWVPGASVVFSVRDNGQGAGAAPDLISLVTSFGTVPLPSCDGFFVVPTIPVERGNLQVR